MVMQTSEDLNKTRRFIKQTLKKLILSYVQLNSGKSAIIIKDEMIDLMPSGSLIYDLAV